MTCRSIVATISIALQVTVLRSISISIHVLYNFCRSSRSGLRKVVICVFSLACHTCDLFKVLIKIDRLIHENVQHFKSWSKTSSQTMHVLLYLKINTSSGVVNDPHSCRSTFGTLRWSTFAGRLYLSWIGFILSSLGFSWSALCSRITKPDLVVFTSIYYVKSR